MAWNFRSIGARLMGGVGAAIGSFIDYSVGYVSGYVGGGGYGGYGYSGGGYGHNGYRGGSKTKKAVQAAAKTKPAMKLKGPSAHANTPLSVSLGTRGGSNFTARSTRPVDCRRITFGPLTDGRGGAWGDLYDHYWGDTDKTSSLENLGYDLAGMTHPYVAVATLVPSLLNARRDYSNGHIDRRRALFNVAMDVVSTPYTSGASAYANAMDYADEKGWLDPINDFMSR